MERRRVGSDRDVRAFGARGRRHGVDGRRHPFVRRHRRLQPFGRHLGIRRQALEPAAGYRTWRAPDHGMTFDTARNRVVLFGGINAGGANVPLGDTWEHQEDQAVTTPVSPVSVTSVQAALAGQIVTITIALSGSAALRGRRRGASLVGCVGQHAFAVRGNRCRRKYGRSGRAQSPKRSAWRHYRGHFGEHRWNSAGDRHRHCLIATPA